MKNQVTTYFFEQKNVGGYLIMYVVAALILSCLSVINFSSDVMFWLMKVVQLIVFTGLGILHNAMLEKDTVSIEDKFPGKIFFSTVLTCLICAALLLFYLLINRSVLFMALASSCAFFLPFTLLQSWRALEKIPDSELPVWHGFDENVEWPDTVYLSNLPITFRLTETQSDMVAVSFSIKAPLHMELSKLFNLFVLAAEKNYNIHIQFVDENNRFFGWQFFAESLKGLLNIQLDPGVSIGNNRKIRPDTVIYVKRVQAGSYAGTQRKLNQQPAKRL